MKVHSSETAFEHLQAIHAHIARTSPGYALRMVDRLTQRSQQIAEIPLSGRTVREFEHEQIREILVGPYQIICHIQADQIDVLPVIHSARQTL